MSIITMNLRSTAELRTMLANERKGVRELQPYNGTAPGARAIAECWRQIDMITRELTRRGEDVRS